MTLMKFCVIRMIYITKFGIFTAELIHMLTNFLADN